MSPFIVPILVLAATASGATDSLRNTAAPVLAVRVTSTVNVDGVLSEAIWQSDNVVTDFKQRDTDPGSPPAWRCGKGSASRTPEPGSPSSMERLTGSS